jgi:hypothetical protein
MRAAPPYGEVDGEAVSGLAVAVFQVLLETSTEILGGAAVVELVAFVESVDTVVAADVFADEVLVFLDAMRSMFSSCWQASWERAGQWASPNMWELKRILTTEY